MRALARNLRDDAARESLASSALAGRGRDGDVRAAGPGVRLSEGPRPAQRGLSVRIRRRDGRQGALRRLHRHDLGPLLPRHDWPGARRAQRRRLREDAALAPALRAGGRGRCAGAIGRPAPISFGSASAPRLRERLPALDERLRRPAPPPPRGALLPAGHAPRLGPVRRARPPLGVPAHRLPILCRRHRAPALSPLPDLLRGVLRPSDCPCRRSAARAAGAAPGRRLATARTAAIQPRRWSQPC